MQVRIDNTPRTAAEIEADRATRVSARVTRYTELADARHASGAARLSRVEQRRTAIPLGQPVINGRYAGFVTRLNRAENAARTKIAHGDHWQRRAEAATSTQRHRHQPRTTMRRVERLENALRRCRRTRDALDPSGVRAVTDCSELADADAQIARLVGQLDYWRAELAAMQANGTFRAWAPDDFRPGDEALIQGTWYPVVRVNAKSLTVELPHLDGDENQPARRRRRTGTSTYDNVYGRRRDDLELHSPPPAEGARCTCRITIPTINAEFVPERDGGQCTEPVAIRLTIRHDGTACGCAGWCMVADPDAPDIGQPWTEVVLLCTNHAHECRADIAADIANGAAILEELP
ncbi:DUF3560 domain-containing protein [Luedemannella flava]